MKNRLFNIVAVVFFTTLLGTGWAIENPAIRNPVGRGTVPPSSIRSGLIRSPNPIDTRSNLVVTGNVGGGKHFRGVVPYNAISDFGGSLGSTTLDSFLRRSAGSADLGSYRYTGKLTPYYSQTGTVTTTRAGRSDVIRPPTVNIKGRAAEGFALPPLRGEKASAYPETTISSIRLRSTLQRLSPQELEELILEGVATRAEAKRLVDEQNLGQTERLQRDLEQLRHRAPQLRQGLIIRDDSLRPFTTEKLRKLRGDVLQPFELQRPEEQTTEDKELDVYEQMRQQIDKLPKGLEQLPDAEQTKEADKVEKESGKEDRRFAISRKTGTQESSQEESSVLDELSDVDLSARAERILGSHKSFASFSKDKFNQHLRAAEWYLKQGKYYLAADAYTLASIYKPENPLAYAGKSHALFAAGEYMSSALFLSRALEIFPEYARFKIDIEAMVGDKDDFESRLRDVEQWLERSDAGELHFLLGYVYYQMGRLERAKEAIDAAYEKMPESPAVVTLKKAIDDAVRADQPID